jgi:hypothetical protein
MNLDISLKLSSETDSTIEVDGTIIMLLPGISVLWTLLSRSRLIGTGAFQSGSEFGDDERLIALFSTLGIPALARLAFI